MSRTTRPSRAERYRNIAGVVCTRERFALPEIQAACQPERPAYVRQVIRQLADEGWLVEEQQAGHYRWERNPAEFCPDDWTRRQQAQSIAASPVHDRPRERLLAQGVERLRDAELLAILIRSGRRGESAMQAGEKLANHFDQRLERLPQASLADLKEISPVVAQTAYCQIMAGVELGRRIAERLERNREPIRIRGSADAIAFCRDHFRRLMTDRAQEEFHIVSLDTKNQVIQTHGITVGTLDASLVHPREVFRAAIRDAASSILLVHNHPSGNPEPSNEDLRVTTRLESAGELLGIRVLDHIVVARDGCQSIRDQGD